MQTNAKTAGPGAERKRPDRKPKKQAPAKKAGPQTAQQTIPYREIFKDGICRVNDRLYTKSMEYEDINYQLAQADDQSAIFDGYEILKSVTFDNSRGFALGFDEAAPSPFVTWQFTETENGQKDYYWGHYHSSGQTAEKDFAKRVADYKELFGVHERTGGHEQAEYYRYYSTQRPVDLGTFPKLPGNAPVEIINFDERRMVEGGTMRAWGELAYLKPLTDKQMDDYELRPAPGNPDRATRPSITAQLKEAARRPELPKEPDKTKHNKSHEDR